MAEQPRPVIRAIGAFIALVLACGVLIAATAALTRERIADNRARRFHRTLTELTGSAHAAAAVKFSSAGVAPLCDGRALLRGTAHGYGGDIRWLAAVDVSHSDPRLTAVRIVAHQETPGIADFLDRPRQGWVASLAGAGAAELAGIDGVSGATITSRALTRSLAAGLERPGLHTPACGP